MIAPTAALKPTKPALGFSGGLAGLWSSTARVWTKPTPTGVAARTPRVIHERWQQWQALGPARLACKGVPAQIAWTEYEGWPRGRVVYQKPTRHSLLYADRRLQKPAVIDVLKAGFGLNGAEVKVIVRSDSH